MRKQISLKLSFLFLFPVLLFSCSSGSKTEETKVVHYNFDSIAFRKDFEKDLKEISGIKLYDANTVIAIDDNTSSVYLINIVQDSIREIPIAGDYKNFEDIVVVNGKIYILIGNGNILEIDESQLQDSVIVPIVEHKHNLKKADCEGLCYDEQSGSLLIAYKNIGKEKNFKPIYSFQPSSNTFSANPVIQLDIKDMEKNMFHSGFERFSLKVHERIKGKKQLFEPSAIAIHPISKDYYILSAQNRLLAVYSRSLTLKGVYTLPSGKFQQPEGMCFDSAGNIYFSNEGRAKPANILKFIYNE